MSATIKYEVLKPSRAKRLPTYAPSSFIDALESTFNRRLPCEFGPEDRSTLRGMAGASQGKERESYELLLDAIGDDNRIRVWADY